MNITAPRGGISIQTEREGTTVVSRLSVVKAISQDAGNYTCQPDLVTAATSTVYVVDGKLRSLNNCRLIIKNLLFHIVE